MLNPWIIVSILVAASTTYLVTMGLVTCRSSAVKVGHITWKQKILGARSENSRE